MASQQVVRGGCTKGPQGGCGRGNDDLVRFDVVTSSGLTSSQLINVSLRPALAHARTLPTHAFRCSHAHAHALSKTSSLVYAGSHERKVQWTSFTLRRRCRQGITR